MVVQFVGMVDGVFNDFGVNAFDGVGPRGCLFGIMIAAAAAAAVGVVGVATILWIGTTGRSSVVVVVVVLIVQDEGILCKLAPPQLVPLEVLN